MKSINLAKQVVSNLQKNRFTLSSAESCTGGMFAASITDVPGASDIFHYGFITYSEEAKRRLLNIDPDIMLCGAVSPEVTEAMAKSAREISRSDIAIAITGFAGPGGGTKTVPLGTAFIAICGADVSEIIRREFSGTRDQVRKKIVENTLQMTLDFILHKEKTK